MEVRDDVVRVHRGRADDDVTGDVEGQLVQVEQGLDLGVPGRQGVGGRGHVGEHHLGLVGVTVGNGRQDLLVDIRGDGPPVAFGRIGRLAREQGGFLVLDVVADDRGAKGLQPLGADLLEVERLLVRAAARAVDIEGRGGDHPAPPVEVADEQVEVHEAGDVVKTVGVLGRAAVDIHTGLLAVAGELPGHSFDGGGVRAAEGCVFGDGFFPGGVQHELQAAFDLDFFSFGVLEHSVDEQFAGHRLLVVVGVKGHRLAIFQGHQVFEIELLAVLVGALFRCFQADLVCAEEFSRFALLVELDQPGAVTPGRLLDCRGCRLVAAGQVGGVILLFFQYPPGHAQGKGGVRSGQDRHPALGLGRQLGAARVEHGHPQLALHHPLGHAHGAVGRAIVAVKEVGADKKDVVAVLLVGLPVELLPALEAAALVLLTHGLAGEVERALADGGVAVGVVGAKGPVEGGGEVGAASLLAAPEVDELVVLRAEVRVVWVDQGVQVGGVLGLERLDGRRPLLGLFLAQGGNVLAHVLEHRGVGEGADLLQADDLPLLLAGHMRKQSAADDDLVDGLAEGDGHPLVLATLARPLEHTGHPVGIVGTLVRGLTLGAEAGVDQGRGRGRLGHVQVGMEIERVVGVAVDLDCHAVEDFHLDAAAGVAVQADRVEGVLRLEQFVGLGLG